MATTYDADGNYAIGAAVLYRDKSGETATGYVVRRWEFDRRAYVRIADSPNAGYDAGITRPETEVWALDVCSECGSEVCESTLCGSFCNGCHNEHCQDCEQCRNDSPFH